MIATIDDVINGALTSESSRAVCNATRNILKVAEMQLKYGQQNANGQKVLALLPIPSDGSDKEAKRLEAISAIDTALAQQRAEAIAKIDQDLAA